MGFRQPDMQRHQTSLGSEADHGQEEEEAGMAAGQCEENKEEGRSDM